MRATVFGLLAVGFAVGCSGSGSGTATSSSSGSGTGSTSGALDCAWVASDNCYQTTLAAAESCLPPASAQGVLSSDGASCTYDGGETVAFTPPITSSLPANWQFIVQLPDGGLCLSYQGVANGGGFTLQTSAGTVTEAGEAAITVNCPGGGTYTGNALELLGCDGGLQELPGSYVSSESSGAVSFSFFSGAESTPMSVFSCVSAM